MKNKLKKLKNALSHYNNKFLCIFKDIENKEYIVAILPPYPEISAFQNDDDIQWILDYAPIIYTDLFNTNPCTEKQFLDDLEIKFNQLTNDYKSYLENLLTGNDDTKPIFENAGVYQTYYDKNLISPILNNIFTDYKNFIFSNK